MRHWSLRWSLVLLVVGSVGVAQLVGLAILLVFPSPAPPPMTARQVAAAFGDPVIARRTGFDRVERSDVPFAGTAGVAAGLVATALAPLLPGKTVRVRMVADPVRQRIGSPPQVVSVTTVRTRPGSASLISSASSLGVMLANVPFPAFEAAVRGEHGGWVMVGPPKPFWSWPRRVAAAFAVGLLLMMPLTWWSARRLTRPIERLADASEALGRNPDAPALAVVGPIEVRTAAAAFNGMQTRLARHVDQRTEMMAAIAHDLRTPLTSLRLRAETAPSRARARMIDDITRMEVMTNDLLAFACGQPSGGVMLPIDLAVLAADCVRDAVERGEAAAIGRSTPSLVMGEPVALRRALDNVVANAIAYGGSATIKVVADANTVAMVVVDAGPGIPENDLERVTEPFVRLESSRSRNTGGTGLGLAIAARILAAHDGCLALRNRSGGGLAAELRLPRLEPGQ